MSKKLEKVLEHLINGRDAEAKELLHQVFIEKARAIHEELINMDEESMEEMGGDEGDDLRHDIEDESMHMDEMSDEIDAEETMAEANDDLDVVDDEMNLGDEMEPADDMDADMGMEEPAGDMGAEMGMEEPAGDMSGIESTMGDLEDALAALKAEFEKLEAGEEAEGEGEEAEGEEDFEGGEEDEEGEGEEDEGEEDSEEMDESWLAEFDDLEESVHLDTVSAPSGDEVGSGKFAKPEASSKSPVGKAPENMLGAKPVQTGKGPTKSGFEREAAPSSEQMKGIKDNRRKKADDGMSQVSKEGDGSAMLNKKIGAEGTKSPLSQSPRK